MHRISRLKGGRDRSPCDAGTILLDRIGNTDVFLRRGEDGAGGAGEFVSIVADRENKVQEVGGEDASGYK